MESAFAEANYEDAATAQNMVAEVKNLPQIAETQEWEEDGVHWSKAADGTLSYYDAGSESWLVYDQ